MAEPNVSAILLAAGLSRRMGFDKLFLLHHGKSFLQIAIDLLSVLPVYEKIIVTTAARLNKIILPPGIRVEINGQPETGQSGSLKLGVLASNGDCFFFMNADQPGLTLSDLLPLLNAARGNKDKIVYPSVKGNPSSPALFPARFRAELLALTGDTGGKPVRAAHPEACLAVEADNPDNFFDVDDIFDKMDYKID